MGKSLRPHGGPSDGGDVPDSTEMSGAAEEAATGKIPVVHAATRAAITPVLAAQDHADGIRQDPPPSSSRRIGAGGEEYAAM